MGVITILCPNTGRQVSTGIKLSRAHFERMRGTSFTLTCWACGGEHVWSKRWASLSDDEPEGEVLAARAAGREWARPGR
ncbi:MAG: hypothetical protein ACREP8_16970 [Candidatus Binatia bacterium]